MAATPVDVKCPACGQPLRAVLAAGPPTQWFPCPRCHTAVPVVVPRDPPPLFSWEVLPGLYPLLPAPRAPRWSARRAVAVSLAIITVVSAAFAGLLTYYGFAAAAPGGFVVDGEVRLLTPENTTIPAAGAVVALTEDDNHTVRQVVSSSGSFSFSHVEPGGITLNVTRAGYSSVTIDSFVSSVYDAGSTGLLVVLALGTGVGSVDIRSSFSDLETFLSSLGGGAVVLGLAALVAGYAAVATVRADRPALGVVGGGAGLLSPVAVHFLALDLVFPVVFYGVAAASALGAFVVALRAVELAQTGPAAGPD